MSLRIRQIVLAAKNLDSTVEQLCDVLGAKICYRDPAVAKFGLHNALLLIGDQFLEVVSPTSDNTAAGRHIERHGDSAYMLILQSDNLEQDRLRLAQEKVRIVYETERPGIRALHLHPKDVGAAIVSLDEAEPPEAWPWAGEEWQNMLSHEQGRGVSHVTVTARDAKAMAERWSRVLGTKAPQQGAEDFVIPIDGGELRFKTGSREVITEFGIVLPNADALLDKARARALTVLDTRVRICGTDFHLHQGR